MNNFLTEMMAPSMLSSKCTHYEYFLADQFFTSKQDFVCSQKEKAVMFSVAQRNMSICYCTFPLRDKITGTKTEVCISAFPIMVCLSLHRHINVAAPSPHCIPESRSSRIKHCIQVNQKKPLLILNVVWETMLLRDICEIALRTVQLYFCTR